MKKIPSRMKVAPRYKLLTPLTCRTYTVDIFYTVGDKGDDEDKADKGAEKNERDEEAS